MIVTLLIGLILIIGLLIGLRYQFKYVIPWETSKEMTISCSDVKTYGYATFEQFVIQFSKYTWVPMKGYPRSLESTEKELKNGSLVFKLSSGYIHAGIMRFGDVGMIFSRREYWKVQNWLNKFLEAGKTPDLETKFRSDAWK